MDMSDIMGFDFQQEVERMDSGDESPVFYAIYQVFGSFDADVVSSGRVTVIDLAPNLLEASKRIDSLAEDGIEDCFHCMIRRDQMRNIDFESAQIVDLSASEIGDLMKSIEQNVFDRLEYARFNVQYPTYLRCRKVAIYATGVSIIAAIVCGLLGQWLAAGILSMASVLIVPVYLLLARFYFRF